MSVIEEAVKMFGVTTDISESGYILTDGRFLDLSEKNNGGLAGQRSADHRDVSECYKNLDGTDALVQFMNEGNIRLSPESGGIDISVPPTEEQYTALRDYINYFKGEVILDISSNDGRNLHSHEYSAKTASSRVVTDVKEFFQAQERTKAKGVIDMNNKPNLIAAYEKLFKIPAAESVVYFDKDAGQYEFKIGSPPELINQYTEQALEALGITAAQYDETIKYAYIDEVMLDMGKHSGLEIPGYITPQLRDEQLQDFLRFSSQFPNMDTQGCLELYTNMPKAEYVATAAEYKAMNIEITSREIDRGVQIPFIENEQYIYREGGEKIVLSQATPSELEQISTGKLLPVIESQAMTKTVYELGQTNATPARRSEVLAAARPPIDPQQAYEQICRTAEACGIQVVEKDFVYEGISAYYLQDNNSIILNANADAVTKADGMCNAYAKALVETTSIQSPEVKQFEAQAVYTGLCYQYYLPVGEDALRDLELATKQVKGHGGVNIGKCLDRVHKMTRFVQNKGERVQPPTPAQAQEQSFKINQAQSNKIAENFLQEL